MAAPRQSWARSRMGQFMIALVLLPAGVAGIGWFGMRSIARKQAELLERVPFMTNGWDPKSAEPVGARERVIIAHLNLQGEPMFRTGAVPINRGERGEMLDAVDAQLPPWRTRDEVKAALSGNRTFGRYRSADGEAMVLTLAQPTPEGGVLYILTGFRGGDWLRPGAMALECAIAGLLLILVIPRLFRRSASS